MHATIDVWQFIIPEQGSCFLTYRLAGTIDGSTFCGDVSMEIDGSSGEYKHRWGCDIAPNQVFGDEWCAVVEAMHEVPDLVADMATRN